MGAAAIVLNVTVLTMVLVFRANKFDADELKNIAAFAGVITTVGSAALGVYKKLVDRKSNGDGTEA
jgi:hypothetical protein